MKQQTVAEPQRVRELIARYIEDATSEQIEKLTRYYVMLIEKNNVMNLTAVTDPVGVVTRHFADSLAAIGHIKKGARVIDVGTGAGLPGVPIRIMRDDIELTMLDALNKRIDFLKEVSKELDLSANLVHARAEDGGRSELLRESFDHALSRAVAELRVVAEWTLPFVKTGGSSIMYKGPGAETELRSAENALRVLHGSARIVELNAEWGERNLVIVEKTGDMPAKYPRKAGTAAKSPL